MISLLHDVNAKRFSNADYDLQATYVEAALRILEPAEKEELGGTWFPQQAVRTAFLAIQNQDFENVGDLSPFDLISSSFHFYI